VDELMALCNQLEAAKTKREQSRDRLLASSLQRLNQPADDAETFREDARFTFNHLPRITTRPAHIMQLRQTILNLAVRGRLVPQDQNDAEVRISLTEAFEVKRNLVRCASLPKRALPDAAYLSISPFALPTNWVFVNFDHLAAPVLNALKADPFGSAIKKDSYVSQGYKVYG
jgi:type I restriction enzyme S subunit